MNISNHSIFLLPSSFHRQHLQIAWGIFFRSQTTLPVITVPKIIREETSKKSKAEEKAVQAGQLEKIRQDSRKGNRSVCLVQCKNHRLNHYLGQSYAKTKGLQLASAGWKHNKSKGDHFTICQQLDQSSSSPSGGDSSVAVADGSVFLGAGSTPPPTPTLATFDGLNVRPEMVNNLHQLGITSPTEIQRRAVRRLMSGGGALVAAETGCGKTLAFLVPLVERLLQQRVPQQQQVEQQPEQRRNQPRALIITPGRELATQIRDVTVQLTRGLPVTTRLLLGGRTKKKMTNPSLLHMDILVASFGALSKLSSTGVLDLSRVRQVVLDETDTLLDDSFREGIRRLLRRLTLLRESDSSLTLVGATLPENAAHMLEGLAPEGVMQEVTTGRLHRLLPHVEQTFLRMGSSQRPEKLLQICREASQKAHTVLVFSNQTGTSNWVSLYLNEHGVDCMNVNGGMHYKLRQGRWDAFVSGGPAVLSCTDMVSRGLDSVNVHHVVNFDFPWNTSDYIHRVGRVGRQGSAPGGTVTNFVCRPLEIEIAQRIEGSARSGQPLWNVNANIKHIIERRMLRKQATTNSASTPPRKSTRSGVR